VPTQNVSTEKLPKELSRKKAARKTLMKLTLLLANAISFRVKYSKSFFKLPGKR